jgi:hypothetical protein
LVTATFSGAARVLLTVTAPIEILGHEDADFGMWTAEATPIDAMFLAPATPNQAVAALGGRQLFVGFPGWVASHGLPLQGRMIDAEHLWVHPEDVGAFTRTHVSYLVDEEARFAATDLWYLVFQDTKRKVWRLSAE